MNSREHHNDNLGYWQQAWHELRRNPNAWLGASLVTGLVLFCVAGPLVWPRDPAQLDLTQNSQPPHIGLHTQVVDSNAPIMLPLDIDSFQVIGEPNTNSVVLAWPAGSGTVRVYRHELPPSGPRDLGMPLAETDTSHYVDRLRLENIRYYYSVMTLDDRVDINTITVDVSHATPRETLVASGALGTNDSSATAQLPAHPFGTDKLGRDLLARVMAGGRISLFIGLVAPLLFVSAGCLYGAVAGFRGGRTDTVMMAVADFVMALPFLLFMILLRVMFGSAGSGITALLLALLLLGWPQAARLVRAQVLQLRSQAYVDAARLQGATLAHMIITHILPNVLPAILVTLSFAIPSAIFTEAFLSFIGLGVVPPAASWGTLCNDGLPNLLSHPHELLFPAAFISAAVLGFNLCGDALRDALDVQQRERRT